MTNPLGNCQECGERKPCNCKADWLDCRMTDDLEFVEAWEHMKAQHGYQWSDSNIEKAHLGWLMAKNIKTNSAPSAPDANPSNLQELVKVLAPLRNHFLMRTNEAPIAIVLSDRRSKDYVRTLDRWSDDAWLRRMTIVGFQFRFERQDR